MAGNYNSLPSWYSQPSAPMPGYQNNNNWLNEAQNYLKAPTSNVMGKYMPYFDKAFGMMGKWGEGQFDPGSAGLGQYQGNAKFNPGGAFNVGNAGKGTFDVGNAGTGMYQSGLMGDMYNRAQKNLANPESSLAYANTMDRIKGQEQGAMNTLNNNMAGWSRGSGVKLAAQMALQNTLGKQRADAARTTAMEADRNAVGDSMNISNLLGSLYEQSKGRDLQNMGMKQSAYESGMSRDLQNMGMQKSAYENNQGLNAAAFENYQNRGASAFENAKDRELTNSGQKASAYENAMNRLRAMYGDQAGLMGGLANMLQFQAGNETAANQASLQNFLNYNDKYNNQMQDQFSRDAEYQAKMANYAARMRDFERKNRFNPYDQQGAPAYRGGGYMGNNVFGGVR